MSTVTQPLTGWGEFDVTLAETTPTPIITAARPDLYPSAILRIYAGEVTADQLDTADQLWSGPILSMTGGGRVLRGPGPCWWLGDWNPEHTIWNPTRDGNGPFAVLTPITHNGTTTGTLTDWVTSTLSICDTGLTAGTITGPTGMRGGSITGYNARTIFESYLRVRWGVRFRANADHTVDVGTLTNLYPQTVVPVVTRRGGRGADRAGLEVADLELEIDAWDYRSATVVHYGTASYVSSAGPGGWRNPAGDALNWRRITTQTDATSTEAAEAGAELQAEATLNRTATISSRDYDLGGTVRAGELVDIWDPPAGFFDLTGSRRHRGDVIHPVRLRVQEARWPVQAGMGVWLDRRHLPAGDVIDLTPHVEWAAEDEPTHYTVGALPRTLGRRM